MDYFELIGHPLLSLAGLSCLYASNGQSASEGVPRDRWPFSAAGVLAVCTLWMAPGAQFDEPGHLEYDASARMALQTTAEGPDLLPSTIDLAGCEAQLLMRTGREYVLRQALDEIRSDYDVILFDCAPTLGVLTLNALTAADEVIVPLQCETLSHRGVGQLLRRDQPAGDG